MKKIFQKYGYKKSEKYQGYENKNTIFGHVVVTPKRNKIMFAFIDVKNAEKKHLLFENKDIVLFKSDDKKQELEEVLNNILWLEDSKKANSILKKQL